MFLRSPALAHAHPDAMDATSALIGTIIVAAWAALGGVRFAARAPDAAPAPRVAAHAAPLVPPA
jgi:hypothetical protein